MPDYKSMYFSLYRSVTAAIEILQAAQAQGEDAYIQNEKEEPAIIAAFPEKMKL